jgi:radical SAM superfamily enzyme YgiQ (UPF0313 family)
MKNVYLFQPQYAVEYRNEDTYWLPYSIGCIWSYVAQFDDIKNNFNLADLIFRREPPQTLLEKLDNPSICGFSCYVWNEKYCLTIARLIKEKWPNCLIVFGGAQSSSKMLKYDFIDSIILAEGEENFLEILRDVLKNTPIEKFYDKKRLQDLSIPSPYTTGVFDKIIKDNPTALWSMTFETNRGCPYSCTFCDWGGVTYSKVKKFDLDRVRGDLEWCIGKPISYLICADANFGIFKDRDIEIAKIIRSVADRSRIDSVNLQYAKNSTEIVFTIAKIISDLSRGITVSVQSMNDNTLEAIKRKNLDVNDISHLMKLSEEYDVSTYTEVILGMPLETIETWKQGLCDILEMGQHNSIDLWFTQLLENSELNDLNTKLKYGIKSITAKDYMPLYNSKDYREIDEEIQLVNSTNTITTDEMIESYMYGWMIIHFHISGYTQIYARHCRQEYDISYRAFYDKLFETFKENGFFSEHYKKLKEVVTKYLYTGEMTKFDAFVKGGHGIHAISYEFMYKNKSEAFNLGKQVAESFINLDPNVVTLQENFIYDSNQNYPIFVELNFDLLKNNKHNHLKKYEISPKKILDSEFDFYRYRRHGLIKNKIIKC